MVGVVTIDAGNAASLLIVMTPETAAGTVAVAVRDALTILPGCVERGYAIVTSTTDGSFVAGTIGTAISTVTTFGGTVSGGLIGTAISTVTTFGGIVKEESVAAINSSGAGSSTLER
jgi:hypothetical protein